MLFHHAGEPLAVHMMDHQGELTTTVLGLDLAAGQVSWSPGTSPGARGPCTRRHLVHQAGGLWGPSHSLLTVQVNP